VFLPALCQTNIGVLVIEEGRVEPRCMMANDIEHRTAGTPTVVLRMKSVLHPDALRLQLCSEFQACPQGLRVLAAVRRGADTEIWRVTAVSKIAGFVGVHVHPRHHELPKHRLSAVPTHLTDEIIRRSPRPPRRC